MQLHRKEKSLLLRVGANRVRLVVWVDDILANGHDAALDRFEAELRREFEITAHKGRSVSYLGLDIVR